MYQSLSIGMLASALVSLLFGSPVVVAAALVASGLFAVADAMLRKTTVTQEAAGVVSAKG